MSPRALKAAKDRKQPYWAYHAGERGYVVHARERVDQGYVIVYRWSDPSKEGRDKRVRLQTNETIRDQRGRVDPAKEKAVKLAVQAMSVRLAQGLPAVAAPDEAESDAASMSPDTLTLERGFQLALAEDTGKYDATSTRRFQDVRRFRDVLLSPRMLGSRRRWTELKKGDIRAVWRKLARDHKEDPAISGPRHAEMVIDVLFATARWLRDEDLLPPGACEPWKGWRGELAKHFATVAPNERVATVTRHSGEEIRRLFAVVGDPRARLFRALLPDLTLEATEEALAAVTRSAVTLDAVTREPVAVKLHWVRRKRDGTEIPAAHRVVLPAAARAWLSSAIESGYLHHLETAYRQGIVPDYHIFPEELVDAGAPAIPTRPLTTLTPSALTVDPRAELALELGGELRLGQVLECSRSSLHLAPTPQAPFGTFVVPGNPKKPGATLVLSAAQRATVDHALATYLSVLEAGYDPADRRTNYKLFPSGVLRRGIALPAGSQRQAYVTKSGRERKGKTLTRDAALKMFRALEAAAGVESVTGRGWYGVRRGATDETPRYTSDERVQNRIGGWTPGSSTREDVYQDYESMEVAAEAASVRDLVRGRKSASAPAPAPRVAAEAVVESVLAALPEVVRSAMREQVETLVARLATEGSAGFVGTAVGTNGNGSEP
jgi:hypothetical protein